jgi:hemolysin activation/secretion protein
MMFGLVPRRLLGCLAALGGGLSSLICTQTALAAPPAATDAEFDLWELRVLGNTVLPRIDVESVVYPFLGPKKHISDVEAARKALETAYHQKGYGTVFVDIPEQDVDEGIVRLRVVEGRLDHVAVTGLRYFSGRQIRAQMPEAQRGVVPNLPELQKEIADLNSQTPDRSIVPVLKAGSEPGTVDLGLRVEDHLPFHGSVELNDQRTPDTSPLRVAAALSYDNLFGVRDTFALQYQTAPQAHGELSVIALNYAAPINSSGTRIAALFIDSDSNVATLGSIGVLGKGKIYGLRLAQPLMLTQGSTQTATFGLDYKDFAQTVAIDPTTSVQTPISYLDWSAGYSAAWRGTTQQISFDTTLNFGTRGLVNSQDQFTAKRFDAPAGYAYLRAGLRYTTLLPAHFGFTARFTGQYSADPLISNEELAIGGVDTVRGYLEAEELGDRGIVGSAQLTSPVARFFRGNTTLDGFAFYDAARVGIVDSLPGEADNIDLRSWGVGLEIAAYDHLSALLTWADPLVDSSRTHAQHSRILFSIRSTW